MLVSLRHTILCTLSLLALPFRCSVFWGHCFLRASGVGTLSHLNEYGDYSHLSRVAVFLMTRLFRNVSKMVKITAISLVLFFLFFSWTI